MTDPILQLRGVNKSFGAVQVLHDVDLTVRAGEVTALVGDNGAGKSTLVKCVAGIHPIDSGEVLFEGRPVTLNAPTDASKLGIEVVYQDLALADNLDIVQNMFLGRERGKSWLLDEADMEQAARRTLASLSVRTVTSVRMPVAADSGRPSPLPRRCSGTPRSCCSTSPRPRWASPRPVRCSTSSGDSPNRASASY
jgi:D-xylose transport system ATP-binding protein